jgi:type I restriction and modification enzyme subunit R-like protein
VANYILNFTRGGTSEKKGMPAQARQLLQRGLWGIPASAQLKGKIIAGDRVFVFVGAPDRVFVGDAVVDSGYHGWTSDEADRYPTTTSFDHGITLAQARVWPKPLPITSAWPQTHAAKTNPKALWYGAIAKLSTADADLILATGLGAGKPPAPVSSTTSPPSATTQQVASVQTPMPNVQSTVAGSGATGSPESSQLFGVGERLKRFLKDPKPMNEDGTRAFFIDRLLDALGYSDFDDLEHGSAQASGTFPDYILRAGGQRVMAVEAKRLGAQLGEKEAAQLVSYCSVVGVRWGVLTDGRHLHVYDAPVVGVLPADRLVLQVDLADYADRDDFDTRLWPAAAMLCKEAMGTGHELERHAARELIRTILTDASSASVKALQDELQARKVMVSTVETASLLGELIG